MDNTTAEVGELGQNDTKESHPDHMWEVFGQHLFLYGGVVILLLGTVGNALSFSVLVRKRMRKVAIYNYLLVLSVADTLVLLTGCFRNILMATANVDILDFSVIACRSIMLLFFCGAYIASWLIVLMTVERTFSIWCPLKVKGMWPLRNSRIAIAVTVTIGFASNIHVFWTWKIINRGDNLVCTKDEDNYKFLETGFEYLKMTVYCFIPFIIVLVCNCLIIYRLHKNPEGMSSGSATGLTRHVSRSSDNSCYRERISFLLLTISFSWFVLMLPYAIHGVFEQLGGSSAVTYRTIIFTLMYTSHAINFLLYCITGQKFREELMAMLFCRKKEVVRNEGTKSTFRTELNFNDTPTRFRKTPLSTQQGSYSSIATNKDLGANV